QLTKIFPFRNGYRPGEKRVGQSFARDIVFPPDRECPSLVNYDARTIIIRKWWPLVSTFSLSVQRPMLQVGSAKRVGCCTRKKFGKLGHPREGNYPSGVRSRSFSWRMTVVLNLEGRAAKFGFHDHPGFGFPHHIRLA
ncbi:hypothetical protein TNIN_11021, partial [Trichonephila inaurata madagascariensis]